MYLFDKGLYTENDSKIGFGKAGAWNFDQAELAHKWPPIRNRGPFVRIEKPGYKRSQNQFLNHFRYK